MLDTQTSGAIWILSLDALGVVLIFVSEGIGDQFPAIRIILLLLHGRAPFSSHFISALSFLVLFLSRDILKVVEAL